MADTDKARKKRKANLQSDDAKIAANGEDEVRANLRGLVMSAGNALGILDDAPSAVEAAPLKEEASAMGESEPTTADQAAGDQAAGDQAAAAEARALKAVEWTAVSRGLEFSETIPENEERPMEEPEVVGAEVGDLEPESGEIEAADGDVEPESGDFEAADGDVEPVTGDLEAGSDEVSIEIVLEPETGEPVATEFAYVADATDADIEATDAGSDATDAEASATSAAATNTDEEDLGPLGALEKRLKESVQKKQKRGKKKKSADELDAMAETSMPNGRVTDAGTDAETEMAAAEGAMIEGAGTEMPAADAEAAEAEGEMEAADADADVVMATTADSETAMSTGTEVDARSGEQGDFFSEETDETEELESLEASDESSVDDGEVVEEPTEFITEDQLMSVIESLLFSTDKPVSVATVKQIFKGSNIRTKDITRALDMLASEYASPSRGVTLEEVHGGYQLRTKSDNTEFLRRLVKSRPFRLSGPALEVMAIVAYKQPITKHEIDEIRGVESGHLLRALMERGLVSFGPKSDLPGKPMTYNSTRKFLEIFGLRNIKELPTLSEIDELLPEGIGEVEEKETLSDITEQMAQEIVSNYSEGEDELAKINEQLQAVDTSTEFFEQEKQRERDRKDRERAQDIRERIVLGDPVEEKDRRWLDRYEAKLAAPPVEAAEGATGEGEATAASASGAGTQEGERMTAEEMSAEFAASFVAEGKADGETAAEADAQIAGALEALSDDAQAAANRKSEADADEDELNQIESAFLEDVGDEPEDMTANVDWDEDSESEKGH